MYWKNSNFQNAAFIAGKAHTADEAWIALKRQYNDRDLAIKVANANAMKQEAHLNILRRKLWWARVFFMKNTALRIQGELMEIAAHYEETKNCYKGAIMERDHLKGMMDLLEPHRKYGHLSDHEAAQAGQREYWLHELVSRAENYIITSGSIPPDHFATMRAHPDYMNIIAPEVERLYLDYRTGRLNLASAKRIGDTVLLEAMKSMPLLLQAPSEE